MSNYRDQFPNYDGTLPTLKGWQDDSAGGDACPKMIRKIEDEFGTVFGILFVDRVNPTKRETPGPRFILTAADDELTIPDKPLYVTGETLERLRSNAILWYLDNVGDSILEADLTTGEILTDVVTMWAFHYMEQREPKWKKHARGTGGGCEAYSFEFASNEILVSDQDGALPTDGAGEVKVMCLYSEGGEVACINVASSMPEIVKFLGALGADIY